MYSMYNTHTRTHTLPYHISNILQHLYLRLRLYVFYVHADSLHISNAKWWIVVTLINRDKYRAATASETSSSGKKNVRLHLPSHEVHNDTNICQKARYAPAKLAAATVLATAISRVALF